MRQTKLNKIHVAAAAVVCCSALATSPLIAAPFQNGSFETATVANPGAFVVLSPGSTAITGWTVTGDGVDYIDGLWVSANGSRSIDLLSCGTSGGVEQTFDTVTGALYSVSFSMAGNPDGGVKTITASAAGTTANFVFNTAGFSLGNMGWTPRSFQFTATGTSTTLRFVGGIQGGGFSCAGAALDNVQVTLLSAPQVPVPVGGTPWIVLALLLAGGLALRERANLSGPR